MGKNKSKKKDVKLPSRYDIGDKVRLNLNISKSVNVIEGCIIKGIRFTKTKVRYDIYVPYEYRGEDDMSYTTIYNVDSICVRDA